MNVDALVRRLARLNVYICAEGSKLRVSAPLGLLEDGLRERLRPLKGALMKELRHEDYWHRFALRVIDSVPEIEERSGMRYQYEEQVGLLMQHHRVSRSKAEFIAAITLLRHIDAHAASEQPT